jgi:hypothetical protein
MEVVSSEDQSNKGSVPAFVADKGIVPDWPVIGDAYMSHDKANPIKRINL